MPDHDSCAQVLYLVLNKIRYLHKDPTACVVKQVLEMILSNWQTLLYFA